MGAIQAWARLVAHRRFLPACGSRGSSAPLAVLTKQRACQTGTNSRRLAQGTGLRYTRSGSMTTAVLMTVRACWFLREPPGRLLPEFFLTAALLGLRLQHAGGKVALLFELEFAALGRETLLHPGE